MKKVQQRVLQLNSGYDIPMFGLGTFMSMDKELIVNSITQAGYRHIDTAAVYDNEDIVGEAISEVEKEGISRDELFITTKLWQSEYHNPHHALSYSLQRLGLKYVDLYLIHWPINRVDITGEKLNKIPMHKIWAGMEECVKLGMAKSIGVSNFNVQLL